MKATLANDDTEVRLVGQAWRETFPVRALGGRIALYRGLRDRQGGKYRKTYAETVEALEAVQRQIKQSNKEAAE